MSKNIVLWSLYDFANSVTGVVFFLYFSQWLVIDKGVPDIWFNMIFLLSTVLLFMSAPPLALICDRVGNRLFFLRLTTTLMFTCFAGTALVAVLFPEHVIIACLLFLGANYAYQFSFVFYNPLLEELSTVKNRGKISGIGQACNWIGQIVGIIVTLPIITHNYVFFGAAGRVQTLLPATILGIIFALPMLLWFKESSQVNVAKAPSLKTAWRESLRQCIPLLRIPGVAVFLVGYFFFSDAIITATNNFPIFLEQVWKVDDSVKSVLLIGILITSTIGALLAGWIADRIGLKKALLWMIGLWALCLPIVGFVRPFSLFVLSTIIMGLLFGAVWTVTRAMIINLLPRSKLNFGMSFYTLTERFSTFFGPLVWGILTTGLVSLGSTRYSIAMAGMGIFVIMSIIAIARIPEADIKR